MAQEPLIRVRLGVRDARTESGQVDPARLMELFNGAAANLAIAYRRDEGMLRTYQSVDLIAPVRVGDYLEVRGRVIDVGRKALTIEMVAHVTVRAARSVESPLAGVLVEPPRLVARATGVWLVPEAAESDVVAEDQATDAEPGLAPMSWGGHRPKDHPPAKRRPGPDVHMRSDDEIAARPPGGDRPRSGQGGSRSYSGDRPRSGQGGNRSYSGDRPRSGQGGSRSYSGDRPRSGSGGGSRPPYRQDSRPPSGGERPPQGGRSGPDKPPRRDEE